MNLAQRIILGVSLLLMGFFTYQHIEATYIKLTPLILNLLLVAFVGGGLFFLFGIKLKKKNERKT